MRLGRAPCGARGLKYPDELLHFVINPSRSMRSAWIEILYRAAGEIISLVALHAERVD